MDHLTQSLSELSLVANESLSSSDAVFRTASLVHTCRFLHERNAQLCLENESLRKQIQCLLDSTVDTHNVFLPAWVK